MAERKEEKYMPCITFPLRKLPKGLQLSIIKSVAAQGPETMAKLLLRFFSSHIDIYDSQVYVYNFILPIAFFLSFFFLIIHAAVMSSIKMMMCVELLEELI